MTVRVIQGDSMDVLRTLPDQSAHCCVTSPPYYGLRDYDVPPTNWPAVEFVAMPGLPPLQIAAQSCCLGLESDPWSFIAHCVALFREVRRVLRDDGTLWLNVGDSYASNAGGYSATGSRGKTSMPSISAATMAAVRKGSGRKPPDGIKPKDLLGIPWLLAFALRSDGWYLRQDIIWHKTNGLPESVKDRCTKSHEYVFFLSKSLKYYFDQEAIQEPAEFLGPNGQQHGPHAQGFGRRSPDEELERRSKRHSFARATKETPGEHGQKPQHRPDREDVSYAYTRNKRSVWSIPTHPFKEAHYATFPPDLIEPCVLAGAPPGGIILDPFGGSGTTRLVADRLQRNAILIELKPENVAMAKRRVSNDAPLFADVTD